MQDNDSLTVRHFVSYTGVKLPLKLVSPLSENEVDGRITFFRGYFDEDERLLAVEKVVYGEIEFEHRYSYHDDGRIRRAELIEPDSEPRLMEFE